MSENIDINVAIIKEEVSINAANNLIQVNINTAPISIINPQNYDLSQFTNTSSNPFVQQSTLGGYVPSSRIININGIAQDLSSDRSWTIPIPSITGLVPYIGATGNVNLGEYELKAGQLTLDTSPTGTAAVGTTRWNDNIGSSETTLKGGSVILKNGVDLVARVVNKVTPNTTLTKANYPVVRVSGAQGQRLAIAYAQANNDNNSADTLGLVIETIATNQEGFIMTVGQLEGVNTTGSLQGETWVDGDVLYLSPTTPGRVTNIKPTGLTGHIVVIGYVEYAHANNGKIYVKIMNGWELDELHNVYINPATLANNNILQYDSADQLWKNKVLSTGITIGSTAIASGVVGRVLFEGAGNVVQESSSLFWDATNNRLGIGTSTPTRTLEVNGETILRDAITLSNAGDKGRVTWGGGYFGFQALGNQGISLILANGTRALNIPDATGNVLIGTTTDAGFRLDVNGTARVQGLTTIRTTGSSYNSPLFVENTGSAAVDNINVATFQGNRGNASTITDNTNVSIWQKNNTVNNYALLSFLNSAGNSAAYIGTQFLNHGSGQNGNLFFGTASSGGISPKMTLFSTGNIGINTTTDAGYRLDVNGTARVSGVTTVSISASASSVILGNATANADRIIDATGYVGNRAAYRFNNINGGTAEFGANNLTYNNRLTCGTQGNIGLLIIGATGTAVAGSSVLELQSTTQGFLPPRMTTTQRNAIASPAAGLMVYDTDLNRPCFYNGSSWITL